MVGRGNRLAFVTCFIACGLAAIDVARGQATNQSPTEPAALAAPATASPATPATAAPQPKMARIWANEPPLVRLARDRFGDDFNEIDAKFFAAVAANEWADFRPAEDTTFEAANPASWDAAPVLKANRIAWLCTDSAAVRLMPSRGIWLRGASIEGQIELYRADVPFSLTMFDCLLSNGMNIEHATLQELDIRTSCSAALNATGVEVRENIFLIGTCVYGGATFTDAQIAVDFDFTGGQVSFGMPNDDHAKPGIAITFRDAKVGGDIRLGEKFRARGQVYMYGAQLGRSLVCTNSEFSNTGDAAIDAQRGRFGGSVEFDGSFKAEGGVNLRRARIGGDIDCDGGRFIAANVDALNADLVSVGEQVYLGDGFHAEGEVRMIGATVDGDIDCDNGHFLHPDGDSLSLDGAEIGRSLRIGYTGEVKCPDESLPDGFLARGTVRLWGAKIKQDILGGGAEFETPERAAILACNLCVDSRVVMMAAKVQGAANFSNAEVGHEMDLRGAHFDGTKCADKVAFVGNGMHVHGHLHTSRMFAGDTTIDFRVDGSMSMAFATIGMHWELDYAKLNHPGGDALEASDCRVGGYVRLDSVAIDGRASFSRAKIDGMWILVNILLPSRLHLDLRFAHIWVIMDRQLCDWPPAGQIQLEGLVYDHFDDDSPLSVQDRIAWLRRQYAPIGLEAEYLKYRASLGLSKAKPQRSRVPRIDMPVDHRTSPALVTPAGYEAEGDQPAEGEMTSESAAAANPITVPAAQTDTQMVAAPGMATPAPDHSADEPAQLSVPGDDDAQAENVDGFEPAEELAPAWSPDIVNRRYLTQPYTQLASVYRAIGQDEEANAVLVARAQRIGELSPFLSAQGLWYRYLGRLIGYGYEPFRAIKIGVGIVVIGSIVFAIGARRNLMAETKLAEQVLSQENEPRLVSATYPRFNPLVYSLDVFLPFVDLQQICYWLPGERLHGPRASRNCLLHIGRWSLKWSGVLRTYFWFQTLAGWTLCTLLAAAVTGIVES